MKDNSTPHSASHYDDQVRMRIPYYDAFHSETLRLVQSFNPDPQVWLDTGCGTGSLVEKALKRFPNCKFLLADPSEMMMKTAKQKLAADEGRVEFLPLCDSQSIRRDKETIDVITAIQAHHYCDTENRAKSTQRCFELLKCGGIYITFENIRQNSDETTMLGLGMWREFQQDQGLSAEDTAAHLARFDKEFFPITIDEHLAILNYCGFREFAIFWVSVMQAGFYAIK